MVPLVLCVVVVATKSQAPGAAAEVEGVLLLDCRLDHRDLVFSPDGMLGSAGAVLDKGGRQGVCHRPDFVRTQCVD